MPISVQDARSAKPPILLARTRRLRGNVSVIALSPGELNDWLHRLEDNHGRRRDVPRFSSRTLDIDLVFYDALILEGPGNLKLPRPELKHAFVLEPLAALAPDFIEPMSGRSLAALWQAHADHLHPAPAEERVL